MLSETSRITTQIRLSAGERAPIPDLDEARSVLEDFWIFWQDETTTPEAKRQFLNLVFESVWLDGKRVAAVQPKPSFVAFFEKAGNRKLPQTRGVKYGSDGGQTPSGHRIGLRL